MKKIFKRIVIIAALILLAIILIQIALYLKVVLGMYFTNHLI